MKKVTKTEFFNFFRNKNVSTHAESSKIWIVTIRGYSTVIAKSVEIGDEEEFFISE